MATPHDSLVKRVFSVREDAIGELRSVLPPEVSAALDLERLEVEEGTFVDPIRPSSSITSTCSTPCR
ncbi:MAG: Rpn family recombination-promoting nuclease/putative transposase [Polyangiaceae bacterium]|nr:Rpn family recombination-promoting nuclease/putative transposase [Polyangiaceae bacterium]